MHWAKKTSSCRNCGTQRHPHRGKGFCSKCYGLGTRLERIQSWDLSRPETLVGYPREPSYRNTLIFERVKEGVRIQVQERLETIRVREVMRTVVNDPICIEYQLRRLAAYAGAKNKDILFGIAGYIGEKFNPEQQQALYGLLHRIEEDIPWTGINWYRVFSDTRGNDRG